MGVIADQRVNVDNALEIGESIQNQFTGKKFGEIKCLKKDQVKTFAIMRKSVVSKDVEMFISSNELYQRLIASTCTGQLDPRIFEFKLAAVPSSMFHDDRTMRKSNKSDLMNYICDFTPWCIYTGDIIKSVTTIFDGCALLHQITWPKIGTINSLCKIFLSVVKDSNCEYQSVVFDSYGYSTTKSCEQKRHKTQSLPCADIFTENTPVPKDRQSFLANEHNKQALINLLSFYLEDAGVEVLHAGEKGDADIIIVKTPNCQSGS